MRMCVCESGRSHIVDPHPAHSVIARSLPQPLGVISPGILVQKCHQGARWSFGLQEKVVVVYALKLLNGEVLSGTFGRVSL